MLRRWGREEANVLMGSWFILTSSRRSGKLVTILLIIRSLLASKHNAYTQGHNGMVHGARQGFVYKGTIG
jgi:hypothetical protein